ncbi:MAG: hypothetical protein ACO1N0_02005 [Fluviicola sp.]
MNRISNAGRKHGFHMNRFRGIARVVWVAPDKIVLDIGDGKTETWLPRQFPEILKVGDFVQHCEHGYYDIVAEKGNCK